MALTKVTSSVIEPGSIEASSLEDSGVTSGEYGSASAIPVLTVNQQGLVTAVSTTAVAGVSDVQYNTSTGVLTIDTSDGSSYTVDLSVGTGDTLSLTGLSVTNTITGQISSIGNHDTDDLSEGSTNLYYTDARVASYLSANDFDTATNIIASITASAPTTLDTLNELAAALGDDPNFATTVSTNIGTKVSKSGDNMTGNLSFGDNDKAVFGAGSDLQIYHDGSKSYITDQGTGNLKILADDLYLQNASETYRYFVGTGSTGQVTLKYEDTNKLSTTSTGVDVTGNVDISSGQLDLDPNYRVRWGASNNYSIMSDNANYIQFNTAGSEAVRIDNSGNVGIGVNSPNSYLDVANNMRVTADSDDAHFVLFTPTTIKSYRVNDLSTQFTIYTRYNQDLDLGTNNTTRMCIKGDGSEIVMNDASIDQDFRVESNSNSHALFVRGSDSRVGIGTDSPSGVLDVRTNSTSRIYVTASGDLVVGSENGGDLLQLIDHGATNATDANPIMEFSYSSVLGGSTTRMGYLGYGSTGDTTLRVLNEVPGSRVEVYARNSEDTFTREVAAFSADGVVFNQDSADIDFRVESDANDHMLFVDAGNNRVGINDSSPDAKLSVNGAFYAASQYRMNKEYQVPPSTWVTIDLKENGDDTLVTNWVYEVVLNTTATGTDTGYRFLVWYGSNLSWNMRVIGQGGDGSNHPKAQISGNTIQIATDHANQYPVRVDLTATYTGNQEVDAAYFGPKAAFTRYGWGRTHHSGDLSMSTGGSTPDATTDTYLSGLTITGGNQRLNIDVSNSTNGGAHIQTRHESETYPGAYYPLKLNPLGGHVFVNEAGHSNADFRVESNNLSNALMVDAGDDAVIVGNALQTSAKLNVGEGADSKETIHFDRSLVMRNHYSSVSGPTGTRTCTIRVELHNLAFGYIDIIAGVHFWNNGGAVAAKHTRVYIMRESTEYDRINSVQTLFSAGGDTRLGVVSANYTSGYLNITFGVGSGYQLKCTVEGHGTGIENIFYMATELD